MKLGDYTFLFNPKYNTYSGKTQFKTFLWNGLFKVMKVPSHSNYILRKTGTHETQCIHRMRLRKFNPHEKVSDFQVDESQFFNDSAVIDEPELFFEWNTSGNTNSRSSIFRTRGIWPQKLWRNHHSPRTWDHPVTKKRQFCAHDALNSGVTTPPCNEPPAQYFRRATTRTSALPSRGRKPRYLNFWSHSFRIEPHFLRCPTWSNTTIDWASSNSWTNHNSTLLSLESTQRLAFTRTA